MIQMSRKIIIDLLFNIKRCVRDYPLLTVSSMVILLIPILGFLFIDWSAKLSTAQISLVRNFVIRTNSPVVMEKYNAMIEDGSLSVRETEKLIEVAKAQDPEYGLISDQKNNK